MTYSEIAREYLIREGLSGDRIIKIGSPMFEVLNFYSNKMSKSSILNNLSLKKDKYFLVSSHREENISDSEKFITLINNLNQLARDFKLPIIVSTHPRTRKKLNEQNLKTDSLIQFLDPLGFIDYNVLQKNAFVVLSDSGTISEESSILNFKALNIRETHERPEAMEEASVMMVGFDYDNILRGIEEVGKQFTANKRNFNMVADYSKSNVSLKVVRIILSYTSYINRVVWQKK
jgi:UDP-N-acetylglucosamine 2-epimerase (non-hydrolysing)